MGSWWYRHILKLVDHLQRMTRSKGTNSWSWKLMNKRKKSKSNTYPAFLLWAEQLGNPKVGKVKSIFFKFLKLKNFLKIVKLEDHRFCNPQQINAFRQQLPAAAITTQIDTPSIPVKEHLIGDVVCVIMHLIMHYDFLMIFSWLGCKLWSLG